MTDHSALAKLTIRAYHQPTQVGFEPLGTEFTLSANDNLTLECPLEDLKEIAVDVWDGGISIWLPNPGSHTVLNSDGKELDQV